MLPNREPQMWSIRGPGLAYVDRRPLAQAWASPEAKQVQEKNRRPKRNRKVRFWTPDARCSTQGTVEVVPVGC